jgi:hypothetical protein
MQLSHKTILIETEYGPAGNDLGSGRLVQYMSGNIPPVNGLRIGVADSAPLDGAGIPLPGKELLFQPVDRREQDASQACAPAED